MPTKIVANVQTGEVIEVELEGAELETYNQSLAEQAAAASQVTQDSQPASGQNTTNS